MGRVARSRRENPARSAVHRRLARRRGVSPIIATIMLIGIMVVLVVVLYEAVVVPLPQPIPSIGWQTNYNGGYPVYGDGSDCKSGTCLVMPAMTFTILSKYGGAIPYSQIVLTMWCGGTVYITGTLTQLTGQLNASWMPSSTAPQLQKCGAFTPPKAAFNRLLLWIPSAGTSKVLSAGDTLILFVNTPLSWVTTDDDYHGTPASCASQQGSCYITLVDTNANGAVLSTLPIDPNLEET